MSDDAKHTVRTRQVTRYRGGMLHGVAYQAHVFAMHGPAGELVCEGWGETPPTAHAAMITAMQAVQAAQLDAAVDAWRELVKS